VHYVISALKVNFHVVRYMNSCLTYILTAGNKENGQTNEGMNESMQQNTLQSVVICLAV